MLSEPRIRRRTVVGGGLVGAAAIGLAGCDAGSSGGLREQPVSTGAATASDPAVAAALDAIAAAAGVVRAQRRAFPRLRGELRGWERLHVQHARALGGQVHEVSVRRADDIATARATVAGAEDRLRRQLVQGSVSADDGGLALLLGSMSAAVAQRLAAS